MYGVLNGGAELGPYPAPATGSSQDMLNFGDTWTIKLYTPGKKELLTSLTITTKRPDKNADGPCAQQCIKGVEVDAHGTFANFHVITTAPVKVILEAHVDGQSLTASATFNLGQDPDWKTYLLNLTPNMKYIYNVKATDANGNTQYASGPFKTLHRQVTVNFTKIHVIDDSDALSAGDFIFWFNTNGVWDTFVQFPSNGEIEINSGETVNASYSKVVLDPPDSTKIAVFGWDDDCDFFDGLCTSGIGPGGADHGSTSEADWATAGGAIDVTTSGMGEVQISSFSITTNQWKVKFTVTGTYTVDYVP